MEVVASQSQPGAVLRRRAAMASFRSFSCTRALRGVAVGAGAGSRHRRHLRQSPLPAARRVVATSEFWYEDEEEFDALTDAMKPKTVVLVAAPPPASAASEVEGVEALRAYLQPLTFNQAFSSQQDLAYAQQLWAGRDKAPYFLKVRTRAALDAAAGEAAAAAAAAELWAELLQQNWRVELDAGLGGEVPESEALLVVCSPAAVQGVLAAAASSSGTAAAEAAAAPAPGSVSVLQVDGTQAGDPLDWQQLTKRVVLASVLPGSSGSDSITAALQAATAQQLA